jgi:SAC3 family protein LENG8/THP3
MKLHRYRTVPLAFIHRELAFDDLPSARDLLSELNAATFTNPNAPDKDKILDCKPAAAPLSQAFEEKYRKVQLKGRI